MENIPTVRLQSVLRAFVPANEAGQ